MKSPHPNRTGFSKPDEEPIHDAECDLCGAELFDDEYGEHLYMGHFAHLAETLTAEVEIDLADFTDRIGGKGVVIKSGFILEDPEDILTDGPDDGYIVYPSVEAAVESVTETIDLGLRDEFITEY